MRIRWMWFLISLIVVTTLAGCSQGATPLTAVPPATPQPTITPNPSPNVLAEQATPVSDEAIPVVAAEPDLQQTAAPVIATETIQEEGMTETSPIPTPADPDLQPLIDQARQDLARRLDIDIDLITVLEVREVTWPDTSLGCPAEGMAYQQVPQAGFLIRLGAERQMYFYHSDTTGPPFLCEQIGALFNGTPKVDELVPPPDWEIE